MPRLRRQNETPSEEPTQAGSWGLVSLLLLGLGLGLAYIAFSSGPFWSRGHDVPRSSDSARSEGSGQDTGESLIGPVRVIDGDSLAQGDIRIRLEGVDAPELGQRCLREGVEWACGQRARDELANLVGSREVRCVAIGLDRYRRVLAKCYVDETLIQSWMVSNGWAVAYSEYSREYEGLESSARLSSRGVWSGEFVRPSEYRKR